MAPWSLGDLVTSHPPWKFPHPAGLFSLFQGGSKLRQRPCFERVHAIWEKASTSDKLPSMVQVTGHSTQETESRDRAWPAPESRDRSRLPCSAPPLWLTCWTCRGDVLTLRARGVVGSAEAMLPFIFFSQSPHFNFFVSCLGVPGTLPFYFSHFRIRKSERLPPKSDLVSSVMKNT